MKKQLGRMLLAVILLLTVLASCANRDERLAAMATEQAQRQAAQSNKILELQRDLVAGTHELIEADAKSQTQFIEAHNNLRGERSLIDQQRDRLEAERVTLAKQRHIEPVLATTIGHLGLLLVCALPLMLCWKLLRNEPREEHVSEITELLLDELIWPRRIVPRQDLPEPTAPELATNTTDRRLEEERC